MGVKWIKFKVKLAAGHQSTNIICVTILATMLCVLVVNDNT